MKILLAILLIMLSCLEPIEAAPAVPIWTATNSINNFFSSDFYNTNKLFQPGEMKHLKISSPIVNGTRFSVGYDFNRKDVLGAENNGFMAGVDKQLTENWWVTIGYQAGTSLFSGITAGATHNITPRIAVSVGYLFNNNDALNNIIKTQLFIVF